MEEHVFNSVSKGGRGESPEPLSGETSTAHESSPANVTWPPNLSDPNWHFAICADGTVAVYDIGLQREHVFSAHEVAAEMERRRAATRDW